MANPETYPEIPSPSGASFRTLEGSSPTPRRMGSPTPARRADERSRLLDRSEDSGYTQYGTEQAERVERRRRSSSYAVINTGTSSAVDIHGLNGNDIGGFSIFLISPAQLLFAEGAHWMCVQMVYRGLRSPRQKGLQLSIGGSE